MKILHITASYKPAYIYGGPIYSVGALCEASTSLSLTNAATEDSTELSLTKAVRESEVRGPKSGSSKLSGMESASMELITDLEVITTLANGKEELNYPSGEVQLIDGVTVRYFKRLTKDHTHFSPALLLWLWKNAKNHNIIHIHSWWNLVSMGAVLICIFKGIRPVLSSRGMLGEYTFSKGKRIFHKFIGKYLLRKCNFHATTHMEAEEIALEVGRGKSVDGKQKFEIVDLMEEGVESRKWEVESGKYNYKKRLIYVIHNIVKLPDTLPVKAIRDQTTLKLIFLSRIHPKKGIELLIDALAQLDILFSLTIVGEGEPEYMKSLKLKAESLRLENKISWMGAVYGDEKFQLLADHDVLVLPSYNENFANVVIESIAVGTPVIISNKVGLSQFVKQHQLGLVHTLDSPSLIESIRNFAISKPTFVAQKDFSSLHLIQQYLKMYHAQ